MDTHDRTVSIASGLTCAFSQSEEKIRFWADCIASRSLHPANSPKGTERDVRARSIRRRRWVAVSKSGVRRRSFRSLELGTECGLLRELWPVHLSSVIALHDRDTRDTRYRKKIPSERTHDPTGSNRYGHPLLPSLLRPGSFVLPDQLSTEMECIDELTLRSSLPLTFSSNFELLSKAFSLPSSNLFLCFLPTVFPPFFFLLSLTPPPGVIIVAGSLLFFANLAGRAVEEDEDGMAF